MTNLDESLKAVHEAFGSGSLAKLDAEPQKIERISTSCSALDQALGGGIARGRVCEIFGNEGTGKTTLLYHLIAGVQAENGLCVFVDTEHALDKNYASACGVDVSNLYLSQPDSAEEALEIASIMADSASIICLDSIAGLTPRAELEGQIGEWTVGLTPRLIGQFLRGVAGKLRKSGCALVMTNQIRIDIGKPAYMNPEITPGGKSVKFYSSQRVRLRIAKPIKQGEEQIGALVEATVVKNRTAAPYQKATYELTYGKGIDVAAERLETALRDGTMAEKSKGWFEDANGTKYHGKAAAKEAIMKGNG